MRYYFVTFHGRIISRAARDGGLSQTRLGALVDRDALASVDLEPDIARMRYHAFVAGTSVPPVAMQIRHLGTGTLNFDQRTKTVTVERDGGYLSAQPDGTMQDDRTAAKAWERFVLCSDDDLDLLNALRSNSWIVKSTRALLPAGSVGLASGHALQVGALRVPLASNLAAAARPPFRLTLLLDGWRIEELVLFKPLIYYVASGPETVMSQLYLSLRSLAQIGNYTGDILVFTDHSLDEIRHHVPWLPPERIAVAETGARDWVGYNASKYAILEHDAAYQFQPVAYMDADIMFNTDATSFLIPMAVSDRLTAPIELFSHLQSSPSVGATLLQLDNAQPRYGCGFNAGTIGIPNLSAHRHTVELIRRVIENFLAERGRGALRWVDQEAANYVSYKIAHFDLSELSKCVRYERSCQKGLGPLTGLIHFWPVPKAQRVAVMQEYLDLLLAHAGIDPAEQPRRVLEHALAAD